MASLKDIKSINISGAVALTVPGTLDVPESMLYYLKNQPNNYTSHQGMVWRLITRGSGYFGRYADRVRAGKVTNSDADITDGWIYYSFVKLMGYYFYSLVGSVTFEDAADLLSPNRHDAEFVAQVFMPLISWLETLCDVIIVFTEPTPTDPVNNLANAIKSVTTGHNNEEVTYVSPTVSLLSNTTDPEIRYTVYKVEVTNTLDRVDGYTINSNLKFTGGSRVSAFRLESNESIDVDGDPRYLYVPDEFTIEPMETFDFTNLPSNDYNFSFIRELGSILCDKNNYKFIVLYYH